MTALLEARGLTVGYVKDVPVIEDLDLVVGPGEIVGLFGPNGAGKTTTMLAIAGELKPVNGEVLWHDKPTRVALHKRARMGLSFVTEERSIFPSLTVLENLKLSRGLPAATFDMFPELEAISNRRAGLLSGGEQQMLTLGRAISANPSVLIVDELSLGLAPQIVDRLFETIRSAADEGIGVLLVEQHVTAALAVVDRVYVMSQGRVQFSGTTAEVSARITELEAAYFG